MFKGDAVVRLPANDVLESSSRYEESQKLSHKISHYGAPTFLEERENCLYV